MKTLLVVGLFLLGGEVMAAENIGCREDVVDCDEVMYEYTVNLSYGVYKGLTYSGVSEDMAMCVMLKILDLPTPIRRETREYGELLDKLVPVFITECNDKARE